MADATPTPAPADPKEAEKKARERVDQLIARAASTSQGSVTLGGQKMDYAVSAAFMPVLGSAMGATRKRR